MCSWQGEMGKGTMGAWRRLLWGGGGGVSLLVTIRAGIWIGSLHSRLIEAPC